MASNNDSNATSPPELDTRSPTPQGDAMPTDQASAPAADGGKNKRKAKAAAPKSKAQPLVSDDELRGFIEAAETRAIETGKLGHVAAVHEVWENSKKNAHLRKLLELVMTQNASATQIEDFKQHIKRARAKLAKGEGKAKAKTDGKTE